MKVKTKYLLKKGNILIFLVVLLTNNLLAENTLIQQPFEQAEAHTDNFTLSSNQTGSVFEWSGSGGVNNTGYLSIPDSESDQIWTTKQTYSIVDNGVYILRAHYKTQGNAGYGSMGFTVASQADNDGSFGSPVSTQYSIGMSFHGGGGSFFSNNNHTNVNWGVGDLTNSPPTWYLFELKIEDKTGGDFDLTFDIYDINQTTGAKGAKWMDTKTLSITNTDLKAQDKLYIFFGADGYRMVGIDNFEVELSDNIEVTGEQTGSTSNVSSNSVPEVTSTPITTADVGSEYIYTLVASDSNGDDLNWSVKSGTSLPNWLSLSEAKLTGTPTTADIYDVNLTVSDGTNEVDHNFTITVNSNIPSITSTPTTSVEKDSEYSYILEASDAQEDDLTWSVKSGTSLPTWLTLDIKETKLGTLLDLDTEDTNRLRVVASDNDKSIYFIYASEVKKYNIATKQTETIIDSNQGLNFPSDLAVAPNGNLYIADKWNNAIKKWDGTTLSIDTSVTDPDKIAIDSNENVYMISKGTQCTQASIKKWDGSSVSDVLSNAELGETCVHSIAVDSEGDVYFSRFGSQIVKKYDVSESSFAPDINISQTNSIGQIMIDANDNMYINAYDDPQTAWQDVDIYKYNLATTELTEFIPKEKGLVEPYGITFDPNGNVYIAENGNDRLVTLLSEAKLTGTPTQAGIYDVNLTVSDGTNEVDHSFQIIVPGELAISPTIQAGTTDTATTITYTPSSGNSLKYMFSNSSIDAPNYGDDSSDILGLQNYTSGDDITDAEVGKYLVVYEVDSSGNVVGFYQKELSSTDIASGDSNTNDEDTKTPIASSDIQVVETTLVELGFDTIKNQNEQTNYVVSDLTLATTFTTDFGNATISWESNEEAVVQSNGTVSQQTKDTEVTLTATITSGDEIRKKLIYITVPSNTLTDADIVKKVQNTLSFDMIRGDNTRMNAIYSDLNLSISTLFGANVVWSSDNTSFINIDGTVNRQTEDKNITITATITKGSDSNSTSYELVVKKDISEDKEKVLADAKALSPSDFLGNNRDTNNIVQNLNNLPTSGKNGSTITWESSNTDAITTNGTVTRDSEDKTVTLTATITSGDQSKTVTYSLKVLAYATTNIIAYEDTNTTIEKTTTSTDILGGVTTSTSITTLKEDGKDINSTVTIKGLIPQRSTLEDGTRKTAVEFQETDNQKLASSTLYQNPNGTIENVIELVDENNETKTAKISSLRPATNVDTNSSEIQLNSVLEGETKVSAKAKKDGSLEHKVVIGDTQTISTSKIANTTVVIQSDGAVETTSIVDENKTVIVEAKKDGKATHSMIVETNKTSKANVDIAGATTTVDTNGAIETNVEITFTDTDGCGGNYYAEVVTDENGGNITKFRNDDENCYKEPTLVDGEEFPAGSESNITKDSDGIIHLQTTTPILDAVTTFEIE